MAGAAVGTGADTLARVKAAAAAALCSAATEVRVAAAVCSAVAIVEAAEEGARTEGIAIGGRGWKALSSEGRVRGIDRVFAEDLETVGSTRPGDRSLSGAARSKLHRWEK
jgi:hypothetical protein